MNINIIMVCCSASEYYALILILIQPTKILFDESAENPTTTRSVRYTIWLQQYDYNNNMITTQSREHVQMIIQVSMYIQMSWI